MNKHSRTATPYSADVHQWAMEQSSHLRAGQLDMLDLENLAEEIESLGRSEKREIESRLTVAIAHLLKWQFQPEKRKGGWQATIKLPRNRLGKLLRENPSLKKYPQEVLADAWLESRLKAAEETSIDFEAFPENCPFTIEQILDDGFLPQ